MKKLSLKNVKNALSRKEMRAISGGYGTNRCGISCNANDDCSCDLVCPACVTSAGSKKCGALAA